MKQVAQRPRDGRVLVVDVRRRTCGPGGYSCRNRFSLISAGTERSKIELGRKRLLEKARARPDLVRKTVERARTDGIASTISVVRDRLAGLDPLGYSSAGIVEAVGERVEGLRPGDRVACGGAGWANHAGLVLVPKHLVAAVPETVDLSAAAFATVGAIAMHSVRQSEARLGERVGVIGLGLVGQLVLRILLAAGCTPVGIDRDPQATALGARAGATTRMRDEPGLERSIVAAADGAGLDSVIVCAATRSADPVDLACRLLRQRGRVVVLGDVPVEASRSTMYEKELEIRLSRSYGPGRYSAEYELHGQDLPIEYVRWTEQRNLQAFIELLESGRLDPSTLTTHRFPVDSAEHAYAAVEASEPRAFGVLLEYQDAEEPTLVSPPPSHAVRRSPGDRVGLIGAGSFARSVLLPALAEMGVTLESVASDTGLSAADVAERFGFARPPTANRRSSTIAWTPS